MGDGIAGAAVIAGIGQTAAWRGSGRTPQSLAAEAIGAALADAGLPAAELDAVHTYVPGVSAEEVATAFGFRELRHTSFKPMGGAYPVASLKEAALALAAGAARYVLVFSASAQRADRAVFRAHPGIPGQQFRTQLEHPYGWSRPAQWYAVMARRHMHEYGTTKDQLAAVALTMRRHAQLNPDAYMYGRELTAEEYHAAPMIADPYQKYDCCLETDGAAAVVLTTPARAAGLRRPPVVVAGVAEGHPDSGDDISNRPDWFAIGLSRAAPAAFRMAGTTPAEMDAAMIYDCFTFEVIQQLEEAGFCARGEGGPFVASGAIGRDGSLPVNTHGGLLSEGHLAGMNHIVEAVRQLRGQAGERQLARAGQIAVTGWGDLGDGALAVLRGPGA
ncbi:thiolase C-terminal domain-containing protein [Dactylosporangium sp. CS-033363]|uniref:thiolase C-terminal domain-containing protein n=1 Tax=Dactylosporangium sp. CS-033363 TaxID=3239935 RepID=UPI003D920759